MRCVLFLLGLLTSGWLHAAEVRLLQLADAVSPATADYVVRGLHQAAAADAALVVLSIDTPGGLDRAMRTIVSAILASPVPVVAYVAPDGARAASAGTYILYASHVAAMAPATHLGAATPVQVGGGGEGRDGGAGAPDDARAKRINDAAAYLRGLAELRGRNAEWADDAVRKAASIPASEALGLHVIDLVAADVPALLAALDGRTVTVLGKTVRLATADAPVVTVEPDWRTRLLAVIADPGLALILMMVGIYGLIFEFSNPGYLLPGVAGAICLLLALFALQMLPVNYAGFALIALGLAFVVAEAFVPAFGALGIGGAVALAAGLVMLIDPAGGGYGIPTAGLLALAGAAALLVFATVSLAARARRRPVVSGHEDLAHADGVVVQAGWARVRGELWRIASPVPLAPGAAVRVVRIEGLVLHVEPTTTSRPGGLP